MVKYNEYISFCKDKYILRMLVIQLEHCEKKYIIIKSNETHSHVVFLLSIKVLIGNRFQLIKLFIYLPLTDIKVLFYLL